MSDDNEKKPGKGKQSKADQPFSKPSKKTGPIRRYKNGLSVISTQERNNILDAARDGHAPSEAPSLRLTPPQETFCQGVASGLSFSDAYRDAYPNTQGTEATISTNAHLETKKPRITNRIAQLIAENKTESRVIKATREARVSRMLEEIMQKSQSDSAKIRAAELLGKSVGMFAQKPEDEAETDDIEALEAKLGAILRKATGE